MHDDHSSQAAGSVVMMSYLEIEDFLLLQHKLEEEVAAKHSLLSHLNLRLNPSNYKHNLNNHGWAQLTQGSLLGIRAMGEEGVEVVIIKL